MNPDVLNMLDDLATVPLVFMAFLICVGVIGATAMTIVEKLRNKRRGQL